MSTSEETGESQLTRKQLRELRMTGSTPTVGATAPEEALEEPIAVKAPAQSSPAETVPPSAVLVTEPPAERPAPALHLARAADPVAAVRTPIPDAQVDLGVSPLTRRQAREQERIRTASVPVITPDVAAAHSAPVAPPLPAETVQELVEIKDEATDDARPDRVPENAVLIDPAPEPERSPVPGFEPAPAPDDKPVLRPEFGSALLAGAEPVSLPPSFDQLIARNASSTGSQATPNALILSQTPSAAPIVGPVTATGEVLITGTLALPDGLGSTGHAPGTADGKDVDSTLVDREIPASSSPTPIAASAAISTVKGAGEIIRPPAPEKGNRLMLTLAITAGALALALVGVLILAFVTGVF